VIGRLWAELSGRNVLPDWVMYEYCEYINQNDRIWWKWQRQREKFLRCTVYSLLQF